MTEQDDVLCVVTQLLANNFHGYRKELPAVENVQHLFKGLQDPSVIGSQLNMEQENGKSVVISR